MAQLPSMGRRLTILLDSVLLTPAGPFLRGWTFLVGLAAAGVMWSGSGAVLVEVEVDTGLVSVISAVLTDSADGAITRDGGEGEADRLSLSEAGSAGSPDATEMDEMFSTTELETTGRGIRLSAPCRNADCVCRCCAVTSGSVCQGETFCLG